MPAQNDLRLIPSIEGWGRKRIKTPLVDRFSNFLLQLLQVLELFTINKKCTHLTYFAPCCSDLKGIEIITTIDLTQATNYRKTNYEHIKIQSHLLDNRTNRDFFQPPTQGQSRMTDILLRSPPPALLHPRLQEG